MSPTTNLSALLREAVACIERHVFVPFLRDVDAVKNLIHRLKAAADEIDAPATPEQKVI